MEPFKIAPTANGGLSLSLSVNDSNFTVQLTPDEMKQIRSRMDQWLQQQKASGVAGAELCDVQTDVRKQAMKVLTERLSAITPPGMMGAVANKQLANRGKTPVRRGAPAARPGSNTPTSDKLRVVSRAANLTAQKRAQWLANQQKRRVGPADVNAGKVFASQLFASAKIPLSKTKPDIFWAQPLKVIADKSAAVVNQAVAAKQIAPLKTPGPTASVRPGARPAATKPAAKPAAKPVRIDAQKALAVKRGLSTVATRRARFLALQAKRKVSRLDIKAGRDFAQAFFSRNQLPTTNNPAHPMWAAPLGVLASKVSTVIKLAEVQGAPAKPPQTLPSGKKAVVKPIATKVDQGKVAIIKNGLRTLTIRRARFLAKKAGRRAVSENDMKSGQSFARAVFIKNKIPVSVPGKQSAFIAGWAAGCGASCMGQVVTIKVSELAPKLNTGELAHGAMARATAVLQQARASVAAKNASQGEKNALLSTVLHMEGLLAKARASVPATGPLTEGQARSAAANVLLSNTTLNDVDKFTGASFLSALYAQLKHISVDAVAVIVDAVVAFWSKPAAVMQNDVNKAVQSVEAEAPAVTNLPGEPAPGAGAGAPAAGAPVARASEGAPEGPTYPSEEIPAGFTPEGMPTGDPYYAPGPEDAPFAPQGEGGQAQSEEQFASAPNQQEQDPEALFSPRAEAPYEEDPSLSAAPDASSDEEAAFAQAESPESDETFEDEPAEASEEDLSAAAPGFADEETSPEEISTEEIPTEEDSPENYATAPEDIEIESSPETQTAGERPMAIELGNNIHAPRKSGGSSPRWNSMTPGQKMMMRKKAQARLAAMSPEQRATLIARLTNRQRKAAGNPIRGLLSRPPTPANIVGETDIMGADFILGAAAKGDPAAKRAIKKTLIAAKKGSPSAKKNIKALAIASRRRKARGAVVPSAAPARKKFSWFRVGPA